MARLVEMDWPDHGAPALPPPLSLAELRGRVDALRRAARDAGFDHLAVYGDREHAANLHWLTGFDPRFEEALLLVLPERLHLLVGNECHPYAQVSPLVAAGEAEAHLVPSLSLLSQPRSGLTIREALRLMPEGAALGVVGWKHLGAGEAPDPGAAIAIPGFLLDPLRERAGTVRDATPLLMHPGSGLRATVTPEEAARIEFAQGASARAVARLSFALREGMTDFEALEAARLSGLPLSCHPTFATGARASQGMSSPTGEVLRLGTPASFNVAHWGSNTCRAGWVARGPGDLPEGARDYLEAFAAPYLAAMSEWCALMVPGTPGGAVWERMQALLPADTFAVTLNPGHLIGLDEWVSSPIFAGSDLPLRSGMAMQMDVIPSHPRYGSARLEDGYLIADEALREGLRARFPAVLARCEARARLMRDVIGMEVPDTLLPLADTCGIAAPFLLAPRSVLTLG